jgi:resuscitation-promoting factor RpfB
VRVLPIRRLRHVPSRRAVRRSARLVAQATVLAAVVSGTVAYVHRATNVVLVLDGRVSTVQTVADDIRGLLAEEGVTVGPHDDVTPGLDLPLRPEQRVVVRFARPLRVTVDGVPRTHWTTALTVADALTSAGIRSDDGAALSASRSEPLGRDGLDLVLSHPKQVTLVADGRTRQVTTTAPTVAHLLGEQGVAPRPGDQLSVLPTSPVVDGLVVALSRIERRRVTVIETIPSLTVTRSSTGLGRGERRVAVTGRSGSRRTLYEIVLADGRPTSRTALSAVVVRPAVARVVEVGSGTAGSSRTDGGSVPGVDGLNWRALARCESGGNPGAVNPAGYYGLFQFSRGTWRSVGGSGLPSQASASEQLYRAKLLFRRGGARQWGCGRHLYD